MESFGWLLCLFGVWFWLIVLLWFWWWLVCWVLCFVGIVALAGFALGFEFVACYLLDSFAVWFYLFDVL